MLVCRLFHSDRPFEQIDSRYLSKGVVTLGRDPSVDWVLPDEDGQLSRVHCSLAYDGRRLLLTDRSTNGVQLDTGELAPRGTSVEIAPQRSFRLGSFSVLIDTIDDVAVDAGATRLHSPSPKIEEPEPARDALPAHREGALLEAFCDGAKLDVSAFSAEEPTELMRRLGELYRQTVVGLAGLLSERAKARSRADLERTTIRANDNNPFKWSNPRQIAQDLLLAGDRGFLSDAAAVEASFKDLGEHLAAMSEAARVAADTTLQALAPKVIEAEARSQGSLLRSKTAVCWDLYARRHAELVAEGADSAPVSTKGEARV